MTNVRENQCVCKESADSSEGMHGFGKVRIPMAKRNVSSSTCQACYKPNSNESFFAQTIHYGLHFTQRVRLGLLMDRRSTAR
jgi:hypothetical protein